MWYLTVHLSMEPPGGRGPQPFSFYGGEPEFSCYLRISAIVYAGKRGSAQFVYFLPRDLNQWSAIIVYFPSLSFLPILLSKLFANFLLFTTL